VGGGFFHILDDLGNGRRHTIAIAHRALLRASGL
jgi:hypothetical protein